MTGTHSMRVLEVRTSVTQRSGKYINLITFEDSQKRPYVAEEPSETPNQSRFQQGKVQSFRVSFPANMAGKKDWIEFIADGTMNTPVEKTNVAIAAFHHVSKFDIGLSDNDLLWRVVEVGNIIQQAAKML